MTIVKVKKGKGGSKWIPLTKDNYVLLQSNSGQYRVIVKNSSGVIRDEPKKSLFVLAEGEDPELIREEHEAISEVLSPMLKKFHESKDPLQIEIAQINAILEGIAERMENREREQRKRMKKKKRRKKEENYLSSLLNKDKGNKSDDDELDIDELPDASDEEDEVEISDDEDDVDNGPDSLSSMNDVQDILSHYGHDIKHIKRCVGRYKKKVGTVSSNSRDIAQAVQRIQKMDKKLSKFFFETSRGKKGSRKQVLFDKLKNHYDRQKETAHDLIDSKDVNDLRILAQNYSLSNTGIGRKIKKAKQKRQKQREQELDQQDGYDEDEEAVVEGGGGGQVQKQKQKQKFRIDMEQVNTIDTFMEVEQEKKKELLTLHNDMNELVDMMQDMKNMVGGQGEMLNDLQENIERTTLNVERGRKQVKAARGYQKMGMGKLITKGASGMGVGMGAAVGKAVVGGILK